MKVNKVKHFPLPDKFLGKIVPISCKTGLLIINKSILFHLLLKVDLPV